MTQVAQDVTRATLALPSDLLARIDRGVCEGKSRSRNAFVTEFVPHARGALERAAIEAAFAATATDDDYQREVLPIAAACERASWEGLQLPTPL